MDQLTRHRALFLIMKKIIGFLTLLFSISTISCSEPKSKQYMIKQVHDGDTIYFQNGMKGRIFGIDAPELKDKIQNETEDIEYVSAIKAKTKLKFLLRNKRIKCIKITKDKYGREIIKIFANDIDIGIKLVELGLARVAYISNKKGNPFFSKDEEYYKNLLNLQYQAYIKGKGIWSRKDVYKTIFPKDI